MYLSLDRFIEICLTIILPDQCNEKTVVYTEENSKFLNSRRYYYYLKEVKWAL